MRQFFFPSTRRVSRYVESTPWHGQRDKAFRTTHEGIAGSGVSREEALLQFLIDTVEGRPLRRQRGQSRDIPSRGIDFSYPNWRMEYPDSDWRGVIHGTWCLVLNLRYTA